MPADPSVTASLASLRTFARRHSNVVALLDAAAAAINDCPALDERATDCLATALTAVIRLSRAASVFSDVVILCDGIASPARCPLSLVELSVSLAHLALSLPDDDAVAALGVLEAIAGASTAVPAVFAASLGGLLTALAKADAKRTRKPDPTLPAAARLCTVNAIDALFSAIAISEPGNPATAPRLAAAAGILGDLAQSAGGRGMLTFFPSTAQLPPVAALPLLHDVISLRSAFSAFAAHERLAASLHNPLCAVLLRLLAEYSPTSQAAKSVQDRTERLGLWSLAVAALFEVVARLEPCLGPGGEASVFLSQLGKLSAPAPAGSHGRLRTVQVASALVLRALVRDPAVLLRPGSLASSPAVSCVAPFAACIQALSPPLTESLPQPALAALVAIAPVLANTLPTAEQPSGPLAPAFLRKPGVLLPDAWVRSPQDPTPAALLAAAGLASDSHQVPSDASSCAAAVAAIAADAFCAILEAPAAALRALDPALALGACLPALERLVGHLGPILLPSRLVPAALCRRWLQAVAAAIDALPDAAVATPALADRCAALCERLVETVCSHATLPTASPALHRHMLVVASALGARASPEMVSMLVRAMVQLDATYAVQPTRRTSVGAGPASNFMSHHKSGSSFESAAAIASKAAGIAVTAASSASAADAADDDQVRLLVAVSLDAFFAARSLTAELRTAVAESLCAATEDAFESRTDQGVRIASCALARAAQLAETQFAELAVSSPEALAKLFHTLAQGLSPLACSASLPDTEACLVSSALVSICKAALLAAPCSSRAVLLDAAPPNAESETGNAFPDALSPAHVEVDAEATEAYGATCSPPLLTDAAIVEPLSAGLHAPVSQVRERAARSLQDLLLQAGQALSSGWEAVVSDLATSVAAGSHGPAAFGVLRLIVADFLPAVPVAALPHLLAGIGAAARHNADSNVALHAVSLLWDVADTLAPSGGAPAGMPPHLVAALFAELRRLVLDPRPDVSASASSTLVRGFGGAVRSGLLGPAVWGEVFTSIVLPLGADLVAAAEAASPDTVLAPGDRTRLLPADALTSDRASRAEVTVSYIEGLCEELRALLGAGGPAELAGDLDTVRRVLNQTLDLLVAVAASEVLPASACAAVSLSALLTSPAMDPVLRAHPDDAAALVACAKAVPSAALLPRPRLPPVGARLAETADRIAARCEGTARHATMTVTLLLDRAASLPRSRDRVALVSALLDALKHIAAASEASLSQASTAITALLSTPPDLASAEVAHTALVTVRAVAETEASSALALVSFLPSLAACALAWLPAGDAWAALAAQAAATLVPIAARCRTQPDLPDASPASPVSLAVAACRLLETSPAVAPLPPPSDVRVGAAGLELVTLAQDALLHAAAEVPVPPYAIRLVNLVVAAACGRIGADRNGARASDAAARAEAAELLQLRSQVSRELVADFMTARGPLSALVCGAVAQELAAVTREIIVHGSAPIPTRESEAVAALLGALQTLPGAARLLPVVIGLTGVSQLPAPEVAVAARSFAVAVASA
jgi:hypothetical protein